jgi:hypothetical protein
MTKIIKFIYTRINTFDINFVNIENIIFEKYPYYDMKLKIFINLKDNTHTYDYEHLRL